MVPLHSSVTCTFTFEAAHRLEGHPGRCRNLDGHSYRPDVSVSGPLDENGVVIDFGTAGPRGVASSVGSGLELTAVRLWDTPTCRVDLVAGPGR